MYGNTWISNYLNHVNFCSQGLVSEPPIKQSNPRFLQRRALSFQKEFSYDELDDPAKNTKDIDASLLGNLPKVSELRKRFEGITTSRSNLEMNRKERIARRLEGIEGDMHPSLMPSLVANRLLEEDTPRYTRANDPCEPFGVTVQRFGVDEIESPEMQLTALEQQPRRPDPQPPVPTDASYSSGSHITGQVMESKAERIARYKAERRRQLAERYGISLDHEPDLDHSARYTRARKESEPPLNSHASTSVTSPRPARTAPQHDLPDPTYERGLSKADSFSERERLMNLENQRRAAPPEPESSSYLDVTSSPRAPARDYTVSGMPPSSPKLSRHHSLSSPKHGASPGDLFIEQQAHSILNRQGIRVRDRIAREEGRHRSREPGHVTEAPAYRRQAQHQSQTAAHFSADPEDPPLTVAYSHHPTQTQLSRLEHTGEQDVVGYPSYLSMATGPTARGSQQQQVGEEQIDTEDVKTEGLLKSRRAVLPSEIRRRERSTEDPRRGRTEEDLGVSRVHSLSQARETEAEYHARGRQRGRVRRYETEHSSHLHAVEDRPRDGESAPYMHQGAAASPGQHRTTHAAPGSSASNAGCSRSLSDVAVSHPHPQTQYHDPKAEGVSNGDSHHDCRVSVAQLRHSYMESTTTPPTRRRNEL